MDASADSRLVACVADDRSLALFERVSSPEQTEPAAPGSRHSYRRLCHAYAHTARPWRVRLIERAGLVLTAGEVLTRDSFLALL